MTEILCHLISNICTYDTNANALDETMTSMTLLTIWTMLIKIPEDMS